VTALLCDRSAKETTVPQMLDREAIVTLQQLDSLAQRSLLAMVGSHTSLYHPLDPGGTLARDTQMGEDYISQSLRLLLYDEWDISWMPFLQNRDGDG
jgi:hypothetical protein